MEGFKSTVKGLTKLMIMHLAAGSLTGIPKLSLMNVHVGEGGP